MKRTVFSQILWRYAALEREVQLLIASRTDVFCSICQSCCCRTDICEEAFDSTFLRRLHGKDRHDILFSDRYGWRTERGCSLTLGRPPICYEFFCDEILAVQKDAAHRYLLRLLGKLILYTGQNALGHLHLVEITDEADLDRLSLDKFKERLGQARAALDHARFFYDNGFFNQGAIEQFLPILHPPSDL